MIAALLLKYGIPSWLVELILAGLLVAAAITWHVRAVDAAATAAGSAVTAQRDAIDAKNKAIALAELATANENLRIVQAQLAAAQVDLQKRQQENDHDKAISSQRAADLAAGRERERVLIRATGACNSAQAGSAPGAAAAAVDSRASFEVDLDPGVAADIEGVRSEHNDAVARLDACIAAYDAVKKAADAP